MAVPIPSERARRLLAALVREYIITGQPVPSSTLAQSAGLNVSSATVRNVLARLEEDGYVRQPHTSAGRVPTDRGYRFYVDLLLEGHRPSRSVDLVAARLRQAGQGPVDQLLVNVSHMLSQASHQVAFAVAPAADAAVFDRIEFVSLTATRVLVVLVARGGQALQKVVDTGEPWQPQDLREAANYLNTQFSGLSLDEARAAVTTRLCEERSLYDRLLARALDLARTSFDGWPDENRIVVEGAAALLGDASFVNHDGAFDMLRTLLKMVEEKERLVRLLGECIDSSGLTVVIGAEHINPELRHFSLVASTYSEGGRRGSIGVIGPTRMRYSRAIAAVDGLAQAMSRILKDTN
ncbi:MAG: heat-inducible transcription repressor HrcA [Acidobacteriota bacterium]|nr:heat-inducible transcription repressor HrcA [Acidobacteriota bacterium]